MNKLTKKNRQQHNEHKNISQPTYVNFPTNGEEIPNEVKQMAKNISTKNKAQQATEDVKEYFTKVDLIDGVRNTLVINTKFLEGHDKKVAKEITATIGQFNIDGTTVSYRTYDVFEDKAGHVYTLVSKYGLRINGEAVTDRTISQAIHDASIKMFVEGIKPGHYEAGLVFLGKVTLASPTESFPNAALLRSAVKKNCL